LPDTAEPGTTARPARVTRARGAGPGTADIAAIAIGGGLGTVVRYLLSQAFPAGQGFPWAIFVINVTGCFALGLLMVCLLDVWPPRRLLRPFLAIGLIGGYTTFSTYAAGIVTLIRQHALALASAYALASVMAGLVAVWCGVTAGRRLAGLPLRGAPGGQASADPGRADPGRADPDRMEMGTSARASTGQAAAGQAAAGQAAAGGGAAGGDTDGADTDGGAPAGGGDTDGEAGAGENGRAR
jgi:CrcB protein